MHCCLALAVFARGREPVLYSKHFGVWPSVKDRLRILGTALADKQLLFPCTMSLPSCLDLV